MARWRFGLPRVPRRLRMVLTVLLFLVVAIAMSADRLRELFLDPSKKPESLTFHELQTLLRSVDAQSATQRPSSERGKGGYRALRQQQQQQQGQTGLFADNDEDVARRQQQLPLPLHNHLQQRQEQLQKQQQHQPWQLQQQQLDPQQKQLQQHQQQLQQHQQQLQQHQQQLQQHQQQQQDLQQQQQQHGQQHQPLITERQQPQVMQQQQQLELQHQQQPKQLPQQQQHPQTQPQQPAPKRMSPGDWSANREVEDAEQRMLERRRHADSYCRRMATNGDDYHVFKAKKPCPMTSTWPRSEFCAIAKIGSTFFARFYKVLRDSATPGVQGAVLASPYTAPLDLVESYRCSNDTGRNLTLKHPTLRATFVREPFSRLFSAYVDKLLSPNPIYWSKWGKPALTLDGVSPDRVKCGHDVSFRQFVRYVNEELHKVDNHVAPMTDVCDPCSSLLSNETFNVIGKMETFSEDLRYFMKILNVSFQSHVSLSRDSKLDSIYDSIQGPFSWMNETRMCVNTSEVGRRIWRKLEIRGLISSREPYPLGAKDLSDVSMEQFYQLALQAHLRSASDAGILERQKQQALVEAYRSLPYEDLLRLVIVYRRDFHAFGYNMAPAAILDRRLPFVDSMALNFDQPWSLPPLTKAVAAE